MLEEQVFQFIQKYTGYVSPGIVVLFVFGPFWKRTTSTATLWTAIASVPLSIVINLSFPSMPFLDQMGLVFLILYALTIVVSLTTSHSNFVKAIEIEPGLFKTTSTFNALAMAIVLILGALYAVYW